MPRHAVGTGAHSAHRYLPLVGNLLLWLLVIAAGVFLWPTSLGGQTALIIVSGHSMEPTYFDGDLVVARSGEPQIGDIIVYRPEGYGGAQIVHRIVGGDSSGWDIQGDNNSWLDPFDVTNREIVGVVQAHVPHAGVVGKILISPVTWAFILIGAVALVIWPEDRRSDDDDDELAERRATVIGNK